MTLWTYQIEMYNEKEQIWERSIRIYRREKALDEFDLCNVENKRKNAHLIQIFFK